MECIETQNLLPEYSVGLIEGRRGAEIELHLASCPACTAELAKLNNVMLLIDDLDAVEPPAGLWNGVYNRITAPEPRPSAWDQVRNWMHFRGKGWSVGFVTAALAVMMLTSRTHNPSTGSTYAADEYIQGHATYASQDLFADQAALDSVAAVAYRDQVGGGH